MKTSGLKNLEVINWGIKSYEEAATLQEEMVAARLADKAPDRLIFVEHPDVVTLGRKCGAEDIRLPEAELLKKGVELCKTNRGGRATFHGPGQMIAYPVIHLTDRDLHGYVKNLLGAAADVLRGYGLDPEYRQGMQGLWVGGAKIASIGIAVKKWVTCHGIALNVCNDLEGFDWIIPCGSDVEVVTSMEKELGRKVDLAGVRERFEKEFRRIFGYSTVEEKHPSWLKLRFSRQQVFDEMERFTENLQLSTVCQEAHCPNIGECFGRKRATFMILGSICTRNCRFCAVKKGVAGPPDPMEPHRVAKAVEKLGLRYAVITSVTRDDLSDGGAGQFAETIDRIRGLSGAMVEVLVPDFQGSQNAINTVGSRRPDMFNHNIETVPRLYPEVRPMADFDRSLKVLSEAARQGLPVKSGLMVGLGERLEEIRGALMELKRAGCSYITIGQYLAPSPEHVPVARYVPPEEFDTLAKLATSMGFQGVAAGPLVRSSYRAEEMFANKGFTELCKAKL